MSKIPTNALMDAFKRYCEEIRKTKPIFTRFKDGNLIKNALKYLSPFQTEMLFLWFLKDKRHMQPTIGAALSRGIINDFINASHAEYGFYNKLEQMAKKYSPPEKISKVKVETNEMAKALLKLKKELAKKMKPFSHQIRAKISEEVAAKERKYKK
jgi:hypothetical protein